MKNNLFPTLEKQQDYVFWGFSLIAIISIISSAMAQSILPMLVPILLMGIYVSVLDVKLVFLGLIAILSFSTEVSLPGGFGTDLPGEPLMIFVTAVYFILLLSNPAKRVLPIKNIITQLIFLHLAWIAITTVTSENPLVSLKFLLAKIWYVVPFYFAPFMFLDSKKNIQKLIYIMISSVCLAAVYVMVRHIGLGLSFDTIEQAVQPIFRNHVNYACLLVVTLPYFWISLGWNKKNELGILLLFIVLFITASIYFSYTRAAIGSVVIGIGAYYVLKFRLTKISFVLAIIATLFFINYMVRQNTFMDYAPDFEKTITHRDFDNLLEATAKGEDISTMERVYRWVAGFRMVAERPVQGYGAGNFYPYYKNKTVSSFETYVSDNPEKSGIHCYYLMTAVEQGIPGLIIFMLLCFYMLYEAEKHFHRDIDKFYKSIIAAGYVSIVIILSILIVNDLLEADKVGPYFFLAAAFIVLGSRAKSKASVYLPSSE